MADAILTLVTDLNAQDDFRPLTRAEREELQALGVELTPPAQVAAAVPADAATALLNIPKGFYNNGDGVRVGIKQTTTREGSSTTMSFGL
jgi:hypothetical protein